MTARGTAGGTAGGMAGHNDLTVGIMGGLGPEATADFFLKLIEQTPAETEQDHLHVLIDNNPGFPIVIWQSGARPRV